MSPRSLNVEKLEKKFASLTKSRESILGLSTWIIRHKEFYKEIVDQWLNALSKDMNALTMFYVANDVIQNCGRKKAPEFREAFSTVLERAVSLEKVKEIKAEVIRMLTLWHERSIYDAVFYKKLQDKLNNIEESESEEELDETDVITNFKLENLTDSLQKLKALEEELLVKEEFLEDIEEPGIANIDNLIVKMDSQKELRKVDKFQKLVESYLSLADKVMTAQKEAMLNLKYSGIFYSAQLEDAKKVAHAYRIYGKKVKILEKALTEKLVNLPQASPVLEERSPSIELTSSVEYQSPGLSVTSDLNNENSNQSSNLDLSTSPKMNETDSFMNTSIFIEKYASPLAESQNSLSTLSKGLNSENKVVKTTTDVNISVVKEEKSPMAVESATISSDEKFLKSPLMNTSSKKKDKILRSPVIADTANSQNTIDATKGLNNEKILKSPLISEKVKKTSTDQKSKSPVVGDIVRRNSIDKISRKSPVAIDTVRKTSTDKISKSPVTVDTVRKTSTDKISKSPVTVDTVRKASTDKISKSPATVDTVRKASADKISKSPVTVDTVRKTSTDKISKSPVTVDTVRKTSTDKISKSPVTVDTVRKTSTDKISKSPVTVDTVRKTSTDKISKSPVTVDTVRKASTDKISKSPVTVDTVRRASIDKISNSVTPAASENIFDKDKATNSSVSDSVNSGLEEEKLSLSCDTESSIKTVISLENEEISSTSKESKKTPERDLQALSDIENIDFLLEKSYNEQRTKSKGSFKRKIDNLLRMKQSKACKLSNDDNLQKNKTASETTVTEDSAIVSFDLEDEKKNDVSETFKTKEENTVNSGNLHDKEKIDSTSISDDQIDNSKVNQSSEMAENSKASVSDSTSETIALPPVVTFTNFPDIPTELLKNILDKTNRNQSSNADSSSATSGLPGLETENVKLSDSNQNSIDYSSNATDNKDISSVLAPADSKTNDMKSDTKEKSFQDNENNTNINDGESKTDTENITQNVVKMTPLMENLQKLLKCFTEKGPAFEELKNSKTLKTLPTYSLRSTLKLYHVLKEHHKNENALSPTNINNNSLPEFPPETTSSETTKSSTCNYTSTNAFTHSKNDNLEIMDMEVDSDDDDDTK